MNSEIVRLSEYKENELTKRVDILVRCGVYEKVIECCDEFIKANPKSSLAYVLKHGTHIKLGKLAESLGDANDMLRNGFERRGLFLKLESLSLLLENPRLRLVSIRSGQKEKGYAKELKKTAERALSRYRADTQIVYMVCRMLPPHGNDGCGN